MTTLPPLRLPLYIKYGGKEYHVGDLQVPLEVTIADINHGTGEVQLRGTGAHGIPLDQAVSQAIRDLFPTHDKPKDPKQ